MSAEASQDISSVLLIVFVLMFLFLTIWLFISAKGRNTVIFFDFGDVMITLGGVVLTLTAAVLRTENPMQTDMANSLFHFLCTWIMMPIGIYLLFLNFYNAVKHNRNIAKGILVGFYKFLFFGLVIFLFILTFSSGRRDEYGREISPNMAQIATGLGIMAWITSVLINGKSVYSSKGWGIKISDNAVNE